MAANLGHWRDHHNRAIGLVLRFRDEDFNRHITYAEIGELQQDEN